MSVGYYNHTYQTIQRHAGEIEFELNEDFKTSTHSFLDGKQVEDERDHIESRLKKHRNQIKSEAKSLVQDLKDIALRCKNLEKFLDKEIDSDEYIEIIDGSI